MLSPSLFTPYYSPTSLRLLVEVDAHLAACAVAGTIDRKDEGVAAFLQAFEGRGVDGQAEGASRRKVVLPGHLRTARVEDCPGNAVEPAAGEAVRRELSGEDRLAGIPGGTHVEA